MGVLTGHSLGGGLSTIVAAQRNIPAIVFSAPNMGMSRRAFNLSAKALSEQILNIIPEFDLVPAVDNSPFHHQNIRCREDSIFSPLECHKIARTTCELLFSCNNNGENRNATLQACFNLG